MKKRLWRVTILLVALLLSEIFLFIATYRNLNQSIQNERIDSIEQMSTLISEKLLLLRQHYDDMVRQAAYIITSNQVRFQDMETLLAFEQLYLLAEDGSCVSLKGEKIVLNRKK